MYPDKGEENWVGAMYTLFSHFVRKDSKYRDLWVRPVNMAGISIDAVALPLEEEGFKENTLRGLEYKLYFSHQDIFNHPLFATHFIICWEFSEEPKEGIRIEDDFDCIGTSRFAKKMPHEIVWEVADIQKRTGTSFQRDHVIKVISLKELINASFKCDWIPPAHMRQLACNMRPYA